MICNVEGMINIVKITGIILAAGNSTRFAKGSNKNFEKIDGKYLLEYSLEKFLENNLINDIIIAVKSEEIQFLNSILVNYTNKPIKLIQGGSTRQESVYNCLIKTNSDIVIIHDGARPLIKDEYIEKCIETMKDFDGATIAVKSKDTVKISDDNGVVIQTTQRKNTWIVQTPQCFKKDILLETHEKFNNNETITDDCMLLELNGNKVKLIEGEYTNIKVTTPEDINLVKEFLN